MKLSEKQQTTSSKFKNLQKTLIDRLNKIVDDVAAKIINTEFRQGTHELPSTIKKSALREERRHKTSSRRTNSGQPSSRVAVEVHRSAPTSKAKTSIIVPKETKTLAQFSEQPSWSTNSAKKEREIQAVFDAFEKERHPISANDRRVLLIHAKSQEGPQGLLKIMENVLSIVSHNEKRK